MLHKCELRGSSSSSALSFRRLEKLVKMKLVSDKNSEVEEEIVVGQEDDEEMDLDDEPDLNLKLSDEEEVVEDDDGDDTDIDDDLLNSFTSVLTTPESPVKRLVIGKSCISQNILIHTFAYLCCLHNITGRESSHIYSAIFSTYFSM